MQAVRAVVSGRVQGVGFRAFVERNALMRNLTGSATNLPDGRVEVVLEGGAEAISEMRELVGEGPTFARVSDLRWEDIELSHLDEFVIR